MIWILGAGRAGRHALESLSGLDEQVRFCVVDRAADALDHARRSVSSHMPAGMEGRLTFVQSDAIDYLARCLEDRSPALRPRWIVPAVPGHAAAEWLLRAAHSVRVHPVPVPDEIRAQLPHPVQGDDGNLYVSTAEDICPKACPEPAGYCPSTGREREEDLYARLERLDAPECRSIVIRSRQLAPGAGGYAPDALLGALERLSRCRGPALVSTACRCHGALTAFRVTDHP